jgi:O-antigen/teichoic acid export membrane protein
VRQPRAEGTNEKVEPRLGGTPLTGRLLARNSLFNLGGLAIPVILGVIAIPFLVQGIGVQRFGLLTLVWAAVGYFNVFGLGLDRALAYGVSERLGAGRDEEVPGLVWTTVAATLALGAVAGALLFVLAPSLTTRILRVPPELAGEALQTFRLLALALPFVVSASALVGVVQARQRFDLLAYVALPAATWSYLGPLAVLPFSTSLVHLVAVLIVGRVLLWIAYLAICLRIVPGLGSRIVVQPGRLRPLLRFGGWLSVSNIVSPLMSYLDRFFVGALLSIAAVSYYATPQEVITRISVLPGAVVAVLFPGIAAAAGRDPRAAAELVDRGLRLIFFLLYPAMLVTVAFAPELLGGWLGSEFAERSTGVARMLAAGLLVNGLAMVAATGLQAAGRPDLTAKLHVAELPLYLLALYFLAGAYGITGVAGAWVGRVIVDAAALAWLAGRRFPAAVPALRRAARVCAAGLVTLAVVSALPGVGSRAAFVVAAGATFAALGWRAMMSPAERSAALGWVRAARRG